jgi:hypothetical protein
MPPALFRGYIRSWRLPNSTMANPQAQDLNFFWKVDQKLWIAVQMVNLGRVCTRKAGHGFNTFPIGKSDKFGLVALASIS